MRFFKVTKRLTGKRLALILAVSVLGVVFSLGLTHTSRNFRDFTEELFCSELSENTLSMHYTVAHPEDFGLKDTEATLPVYVAGNRERQQELLGEYLAFLENVDSARLGKSDKYTYELLVSYFEN